MKKASVSILIGLLGILLFTHCPQTEVTSARVHIQRSEYDSAIEQCKIAIEKTPNNHVAYFEMGRAYGYKRMFLEMNDAFTKSLEFGSAHAVDIENHRRKYWADLFNEGVNAINQEKLDKAIEAFTLGIQLAPDEKDTYRNLAVAYSQNNEDEKAIQVYQDVLKVYPDDIDLEFNLGIMNYHGKKYEEAIDIFNSVIKKVDPKSKEYSDALYHIAYSYDLIGKPEIAMDSYQKILIENPNDKDLMFNMGRLYYMRDDYENAIASFKKALEIDNEDFDANLNIGTAYNEMEKFSEAVPFFEKAVELKPDNEQAWFQLGVAYVRSGNAEKGEEAFKKADEFKDTEE